MLFLTAIVLAGSVVAGPVAPVTEVQDTPFVTVVASVGVN